MSWVPAPAPARVVPIFESGGQEGWAKLFAPAGGAGARAGGGDRRLGAFLHADQRGEHPGRQGGGEAGQVLIAVAAGEAHQEGRVGGRTVGLGAGRETRLKGRGPGGRTGAPAHAGADLKARGGADRVRGVGGGGEQQPGLVVSAVARGDQRRAPALAQVHAEVRDRLLGERAAVAALEGRHQLPGEQVGLDLAREGHPHPQLGFLQRHVDGDQRAEGVGVGGGDKDRAPQDLPFEQRRFDFDRADLRFGRAAGAEFRGSPSPFPAAPASRWRVLRPGKD